MISDADRERLLILANANGLNFADLVRLAGLDPATSFRGADLRGVDFERSNLSGFDFSDADLTGASFCHAMIVGMKFDRAIVVNVQWPTLGTSVGSSEHVRLRGIPRMAVDAMLKDISNHNRALALMPPGSGRHVVIEELVAAEFQHSVHRGLLIMGSAYERDMMLDRLKKRLPDIPIGNLQEVRRQGFGQGLLVLSHIGFGPSLVNRLKETAWSKSIEAVFSTSTERLSYISKATTFSDHLRMAVVETSLLDVNHLDQYSQQKRIKKFCGKPSFALSVEQFIEQKKLRLVTIVSAFFPPEGMLLPRRHQFNRVFLKDEELQERLAPLADALVRSLKNMRLNNALVLCGDSSQAKVIQQLLRQRWSDPDAIDLVEPRWSTSHIIHALEHGRGLLLAPVTRQAINAAAHVPCVATLTTLKLEDAQDIFIRPVQTIEQIDPLIIDCAGAFQGFPGVKNGLERFSV